MSKHNIIDITKRINKDLSQKSQKKGEKSSSFEESPSNGSSSNPSGELGDFSSHSSVRFSDSSSVLSITKLRQDTFKKERRQVRRSFLREFLRAQAVVPAKGLLEIYLQDISVEGVAFDVEREKGRFRKEEDVALRIYVTHDTYFPFTVKVRYIRSQVMDGLGVFRHGASFVKESVNSKALVYFAKFIEHATTILRKDKGDIMVSQRIR